MHLIREELYPGIMLNILPDSRFKTNYVSLAFLCDMTSENAATSHLLPMVLGRGSQKYPDLGAINRALELVWDGTLDSGTGRMGETRVIGFSACYPDDRFVPGNENVEDSTLDIFFDILLHPQLENGAFTHEYVESEKEKLRQRIAAVKNSKGKYASTRLRQELCRNEAYGLPSAGTIEQVSAVTAKELYDFYLTMRKEFPLEIFYIGRTDPAEVIEKFKMRLAPLSHCKKQPIGCEVIRLASDLRRVEETGSGKQGHLCIGLRTGTVIGDERFPAFVMMNEILGGSPISRLFTEVREKQSLCYYCTAVPDSVKGILTICAGIRDDNRKKAENAILLQIKAMQSGSFTTEEMSAALHTIESALLGIRDSRSTMENFIMRRLLTNTDVSVNAYLEKLRGVTKEQIVEAANLLSLDTIYYLKPDHNKGGDEDVLDDEEG